ncbi:pyridoxal phosphate-dependent transferase [Talaromyces proteolyticus]|uniref:Pyridoxal phosphate-dependent transferase n=1 Tax=Talaromyces proteolyticus TaxID=1131652 RepID=A0AAD4KXT0_9EURO|nr:pyridoxal phosphate-dependent transferase [Talaromyces proteolyticus]KAH8699228.1 pyridoxal phosphate-dependent transferase [Talaromyces proteolyticus]
MPSSEACSGQSILRYSFVDDYSEGAHPLILDSLLRNNYTQQRSYGEDEYCIRARELIRQHLDCREDDVAIYFVPSGTSANLISIASCLRPFEAVIAVDSGHIVCKEAGAIEATGHKIIQVPAVAGKLTPVTLEKAFKLNQFSPHMAKPRLVYISNASEIGTVYTKSELTQISDTCKRLGLWLLMDGARIGAALSSHKNDMSWRDIVDLTDIFWIGGTKVGALLGEAIVIKNTQIRQDFIYHIKQHGALLAKGRVIGIQFSEFFGSNLFLDLASHANNMAQKIARNITSLGYPLIAETETNQVFAKLPLSLIEYLRERYDFYIWEESGDGDAVIRLVTSWATEALQVDKRAKVKCIHQGQPPCQRCQKGNIQGCILTSPRSSSGKMKSATGKHNVKKISNTRSSSVISDTSLNAAIPVQIQTANTQDLRTNPVSGISQSTIISACDVYRKRFPVANFLHYPSLVADISSNRSNVDPVFIASLLSMCARFMPDHEVQNEEVYAQYVRSELAQRAFEAPSLDIAQSLVIISFYEWGCGNSYKAWMYIGMAMYMIQSLLRTADDTMEQSPQDFPAFQTQYEKLVRTYWVCFSQDCELSSGARQHFALAFHSISVPLPISDHQFIFNQSAKERLMPRNLSLDCLGSRRLGIDYGPAIIARGFDIFVRILRFANANRRNDPVSSCFAPRLSVNATWQGLKKELDEWRQLQDITVHFPITGVQAHVAFGYGEVFTYINLIFFMSVLFLYRDRFLSGLKRYSELFENSNKDSNNGTDYSNDDDENNIIFNIFEAAKNVSEILWEVEASQSPVITPYSGFSVFVTAHVNMYATIVPHHYPGGLQAAEAEKKRNMVYLERLTRFWPVGNQWWKAVQEADKFYVAAKENESLEVRPGHFALASTLDEYGDIRHQRPRNDRQRKATTAKTATGSDEVVNNPTLNEVENGNILSHSLESELLQWPFIDETWTTNLDYRWFT